MITPVEAFKTSDGKLFETDEEARAYERTLTRKNKISAFLISAANPYQSSIQRDLLERAIPLWEDYRTTN